MGVDFTHLEGGDSNSFALGSDGNIYGWGTGNAGQIGNGENNNQLTPTVVHMPAGITFSDLSVGDANALAVGSDGLIYGWGFNGYGQVGDGTSVNRNLPTIAATPPGVTFSKVEAGRYHSLALATNGDVYTWGANPDGRLGNGNPAWTITPGLAQIPSGTKVVDLSAGESVSTALTEDGQIYAWGQGVSLPTLKPAPAGVSFTSISSNSRIIAEGNDGNFYFLSSVSSPAFEPIVAPAGVTFVQVVSTGTGTLALSSTGQAYAWGNNYWGQLGDGSTTARAEPTPVTMPAGVTFTFVGAGGTHALAQGSDGNTYAWGANYGGQIGDNSVTTRLVPVLVDRVLTITEVLFDGVPGSNLSQSNGSWSATTPPNCGPVDVTVTWELFGAQTTKTFPAGFSYGTAPTITTSPASKTIAPGASTTLEAAASGDGAPTVQWQLAVTAAGPWTDVVGETSLTIDVPAAAAMSYRAVFTNCNGTATSESADVVVKAPIDNGTTDPVKPVVADPKLKNTGGDAPWLALGTAGALVLMGGAMLLARRRGARS